MESLTDFIVFNSKFYELITKNDKFIILKSHFVEAIQPKYQPGIEDKPNLRYRKANMLQVLINGKISQIKSNKKAITALFKKSNQKQVKSYMKSNKIRWRMPVSKCMESIWEHELSLVFLK